MHPNFSENRQPNRSENDKNKVILCYFFEKWIFTFNFIFMVLEEKICFVICVYIFGQVGFSHFQGLCVCASWSEILKNCWPYRWCIKKSWKNLPVKSFSNWNRITQGMYKNRVNIDRNIFKFPTIKSSQRDNPEWEISNNVSI